MFVRINFFLFVFFFGGGMKLENTLYINNNAVNIPLQVF